LGVLLAVQRYLFNHFAVLYTLETIFLKNVSDVSIVFIFAGIFLSAPRMEKEEINLIEQITQLFLKFGIRSMTMDDIARELGISKKTIYKYFKDKKEIVGKVMQAFLEYDRACIMMLRNNKTNPIDEMMEIAHQVTQKITSVHPSVYYDLQKYYPEAWKTFTDHKKDFILNCILENLKNGKEEGFYRKDLNISTIAKIYIAKLDTFIDPQWFSGEVLFKDILFEAIKYHIYGITSDKGVKYFNKKIKNYNL
jgi:TetR/AcrR family transcriptional regulator, cholesterol catabolism regulator